MNTPLVEFVGAGPGAEDLITLRGLRALEQADLVVYAGSLVNPGHLKRCKPDCECRDSAAMNLREQVAAMSEAALAGKRVVRLHTGDPAMYGAINEQIRALAEKGIASRIVPGVSSVFGAAAALGCELTCPDVSQSVVLTRTPGRTPMPKGENAAAFARTGATLVFFLSTGKIDDLMTALMGEGGLSPDTPAAVVYRATWPDERILRGTVSDIARKVEEAGFGRQALIFVGRALAAQGGASRLYGADFSHGYRNHLANEAFDGRCALYAFTDKGVVRAKEIAAGLGLPAVIHSTRPTDAPDVVHTPGETFDATLSANWRQFDAHIFISATGIAVRKIAPLLRDKTSDPAVLSCSESGSHVVGLTSGHLGGANRLARRVARVTGGQAVISTATDVNGLPAFDEAAAQEHARILNTDAIRSLNAALLSGKPIAFCGPRTVFDRHFAGTDQVIYTDSPEAVTARHAVLWDAEGTVPEEVQHLDITGKSFVLGVGCRRGVEPLELRLIAEGHLSDLGLRPEHIAAIASCDVKADEPAILELGEKWQVPVEFHAAARLDAVPVPTPSAKVREKVGTASVSEAACLLSAGYGSIPQPTLYAPKAAFGDVTLALARLPHLSAPKATHGQVVVVGLGAGVPGQITPEVDAALRHCDTVAGYSNYVDFIRDRIIGKPIIQNGMTGRGGAVPGHARSRRSRAGGLHGLLRRPRHSGDGGAAVRTAGPGAGIRGHPDPGPAGHHGGEHRGGFARSAAPERFFAGEPFRFACPFGRSAAKSPGRGAVGPAGDALQSRRAQTAASAHGSARHFQGTARRRRIVRLCPTCWTASGGQMDWQARRFPRRRGGYVHPRHHRRPAHDHGRRGHVRGAGVC